MLWVGQGAFMDWARILAYVPGIPPAWAGCTLMI